MFDTYNPPEDHPLKIHYIDDDVLVVDKPSGLLSVPGRGVEKQDCLVSRLAQIYGEVRIIHRLDMVTSGLMVLALTPEAHRNISGQFERRETYKKYIADVYGMPDKQEGYINQPLLCDWPNRPRQMIDYALGKKALTYWKVVGETQGNARLELAPITGRSHQLRVHCLSIGHPILGDNLYAPPDIVKQTTRLHLHASQLSFKHPCHGQTLEFSSLEDFPM